MKPITVFILCGGKSTRMQAEKGLVLFRDKPFIEHIIAAVLPISKNIVLVTNGTEYDYLPYKKINDVAIDKGPLGGIYTALRFTETESNLILSCDIPLISTELLMDLIQKHDEAAAITTLASESKMHPLIGIYSKNVVSKAQEAINANQLKVMNFVVSVPHQIIRFDENQEYLVTNINSIDELEQLTNKLS
ncbi:molybdenum cofactor guanylyltransferase [Flavobacterium agrisoli]|uniref:Probable molybdenum cofactor guanylyltransferase n=1 Tax=Flavobacterium agrisoli TaxID=2793066 RepID=A0A934UIF9_9FLAO|nr:molybdenum cofactor guanylyltransferase [Flavobacterium agrisoli]MBK0368564.1 molybdenum cofactor guanylyltransferase [Flavobacterium agrisoli]